MDYIFTAIMVLCVAAIVASVVLYFCSRRFAVKEDSRLALINEALPGANCGGCGFAGCVGMATALVEDADRGTNSGLFCPVGGSDTMNKIAGILGLTTSATVAKTATVRCNGDCKQRKKTNIYDGLETCYAMNACGMGDTSCGFGCLGCGDCVKSCLFGALTMSAETGLPMVNMEKCTGCGTCVNVCPRQVIELRTKRTKNRMVVVRCVNKDKGAVAIKACNNACIGCAKCMKECAFDAITINNCLSYIDDEKCRLCRKCETVCPTNAIFAFNFPQRKTEN